MQIQSPALNLLSPNSAGQMQRGQLKNQHAIDLTTSRAIPPHTKSQRTLPPIQLPLPPVVTTRTEPSPTKPDLRISHSRPQPPTIGIPTEPPIATQDPQPLTMQGLMDAWGQSDSPYDLDGDGTVNVNDLLEFINNWDKYGPGNQGATPGSATSSGPAASVVDATQSLYQHLSETGFAEQPPVNIHELVDAMNPSPQRADQMLKQLSDRYPNGLGVDMVG